jgi:hypothetical protein
MPVAGRTKAAFEDVIALTQDLSWLAKLATRSWYATRRRNSSRSMSARGAIETCRRRKVSGGRENQGHRNLGRAQNFGSGTFGTLVGLWMPGGFMDDYEGARLHVAILPCYGARGRRIRLLLVAAGTATNRAGPKGCTARCDRYYWSNGRIGSGTAVGGG